LARSAFAKYSAVEINVATDVLHKRGVLSAVKAQGYRFDLSKSFRESVSAPRHVATLLRELRDVAVALVDDTWAASLNERSHSYTSGDVASLLALLYAQSVVATPNVPAVTEPLPHSAIEERKGGVALHLQRMRAENEDDNDDVNLILPSWRPKVHVTGCLGAVPSCLRPADAPLMRRFWSDDADDKDDDDNDVDSIGRDVLCLPSQSQQALEGSENTQLQQTSDVAIAHASPKRARMELEGVGPEDSAKERGPEEARGSGVESDVHMEDAEPEEVAPLDTASIERVHTALRTAGVDGLLASELTDVSRSLEHLVATGEAFLAPSVDGPRHVAVEHASAWRPGPDTRPFGPWSTLQGDVNHSAIEHFQSAVVHFVQQNPGVPQSGVLRRFPGLPAASVIEVLHLMELDRLLYSRYIKLEPCSLLQSDDATGASVCSRDDPDAVRHLFVDMSLPA